MAKLKDRYADALLELSEETGTLKEYVEQAIFVRDTLSDDDIQAFLTHPHISNSDKQELFNNVFQDKLEKHLIGFLHLLVHKNRETLIVPALTEYIDRANKRLGRVEARLVSAKAMKEEEVESIRKALSKQLDMQIEVKASVDPDLIGGFYILVDGHIFDGTVRSKLHLMREHLKRGGYQ